jgi:hypothetical protein
MMAKDFKPTRITKYDVESVFAFQQKYHPQEKLSEKKVKLIRQRFRDGYGIAALYKAITGIHNTPHNLGDNNRGQKYLSLFVCLREENFDRFIEVGEEVLKKQSPDAEKQQEAAYARKRKDTAEYLEARKTPKEQRLADLEAFRQERREAGL